MKTVESKIDTLLQAPEILVLMEILRKCNSEAYTHSYNVARLTEKLLEKDMGRTVAPEIHQDVMIGALLHDIGKAFLPFNLTQMECSLNGNEYDIVKIHTTLSLEVVAPVFSDVVKNICHLHHERIDGSGYLKGYAMAEIADYVLLVQIADVFDALTSKRAYKKPYPKEDAFKIMEKEAKELLLDDYYLSLLIELEGGTYGSVS